MNETTTATAMLRDEHRLILEVAGVLNEIIAGHEASSRLDFDSIGECVSFFRLFADACHHGKEEDLLFPELVEAGLPADDGPIAVMLYEHRQGRAFVKAMADSLDGAREGDADAAAALMDAGRSYVDLIRGHIDKEDHVLFEMADHLVTGARCRDLCGAYDVVCARRFEGRTVEDLEGLAASLRGRYPIG